jgi:putative acetyltransferase
MTRPIDFAEIRPETPDDARAVRALLLDAFDSHAEADLVDALRRDGDLALGLLAEADEGLAGYLGVSRASLAGRPALALAPLAVRKGRRVEGVGSRLVRAALRDLETGFDGHVVVLGDPGWYDRFGFSPASELTGRWAGPNLMTLALGAAGPAAGELVWAPAFAALPG